MTPQTEAAHGTLTRDEGQELYSHTNPTPIAPRPSRSLRWKTLERTVARKLRGRRIVREDLFEKAPDVLIPDFGLVVECKAYKAFSFHRHLEQARGYCRPGEVPCLATKAEGQHGEHITVPLNWLAAILDEIRVARGA